MKTALTTAALIALLFLTPNEVLANKPSTTPTKKPVKVRVVKICKYNFLWFKLGCSKPKPNIPAKRDVGKKPIKLNEPLGSHHLTPAEREILNGN